MSWQFWTPVLLGSLALVWVLAVLFLFFAGRRTQARALAGFIPDCIVLVGRLLHDPRVPRRHKLLLALTVGYLSLPFDLIPDFIPVVGQLDDAIIVALVLGSFLRSGDQQLLREHWPGPESSLELLLRLTGSTTLSAPEA